jgi:glycosyltransferase involved in cell wall biosynthesis
VNPCLLIAIYEHGSTIGAVVDSLAGFDLPCLIVDDGSSQPTREALARVAAAHPFVKLRRHDVNRGRGAALRTGYRWAASLGHTHAVQLDADGQHESRDVPRLLEAAQKDPRALVLGRPLFDESAPRARLFGRKLSQGLVWLETLSFAIADPLCGMRCMPLEPVLQVLDERPLGDRMDFDPEIAVRLYWMGLPVANVPTRVRYLPGGISHFRHGVDSLRIARAHVRLVGGMLLRIPQLLAGPRAAAGA